MSQKYGEIVGKLHTGAINHDTWELACPRFLDFFERILDVFR